MQVNQLLELESAATATTLKYKAVDNWAQHLQTLHQTVINKLTL